MNVCKRQECLDMFESVWSGWKNEFGKWLTAVERGEAESLHYPEFYAIERHNGCISVKIYNRAGSVRCFSWPITDELSQEGYE